MHLDGCVEVDAAYYGYESKQLPEVNRERTPLEDLPGLLDGADLGVGLWERTVVAVLGDHGQAFGQHDGNIGHTLFIYEENVRVPLLVSIPGVTDAPLRSTRIASDFVASSPARSRPLIHG